MNGDICNMNYIWIPPVIASTQVEPTPVEDEIKSFDGDDLDSEQEKESDTECMLLQDILADDSSSDGDNDTENDGLTWMVLTMRGYNWNMYLYLETGVSIQ